MRLSVDEAVGDAAILMQGRDCTSAGGSKRAFLRALGDEKISHMASCLPQN